jgi:Ca2+-binding EF-hand superfamily protein
MVEEGVAAFLAEFDKIDRKRKKELPLSDFKVLFQKIAPDQDGALAGLYFRGIDIDDSRSVSREEFERFARAILSKDEDYTLRMAFRAFDRDRSRTLSWEEVRDIGKCAGRQLMEEAIVAEIERITGKKTGALTYAQTVKLCMGRDIPPDTDPYEGQLPSKCCLLV